MVANQLAGLASGLFIPIAVGLAGCSSNQDAVTAPANASPPVPTTSAGNNESPLPPMKHFRIGDEYGPLHDCLVDGSSVTCELSWAEPSSVESYTGTLVGTLFRATLTGTSATHQRFRDEADPSCIFEQDTSGPIIYVFNGDGTVAMRGGPSEVRATRSGSCPGTESGTTGPWESSARWSVIE